jgi:phenylacetate-CoA ligase
MGERPMEDRFWDKARETGDREKRRARLSERLREILGLAFEGSTAYQEIFSSAGIDPTHVRGLEDLEKLPILRMADLVSRQKAAPPFGGFEIRGQPRKVRRIYINPGFIVQPGEFDEEDFSWAEALAAAGFKAGDRILNTFNYHLWPFGFIIDKAAKMIGATIIPAGPGNTLMQIRILQSLRPNGYIGTPSFLMTLTQRAEAMGLDLEKDFSLETGLVAAEMLPQSLRENIEKKVGMSVRQAYGTVFIGCIGYECPHKTGLHVPDNIIVEVVDPETGRQVQPGMTGEIVATNFSGSYPMIRMATGDLSALSLQACPCGRTGPMLKRIVGRIEQAAKVRGTFIHPWQADEVISHHPEVYKYQVVITRENHTDVMTFVVELKEETGRPEIIHARIERDIKEHLTIKGLVRIVPKGTIPDRHKKIDDRRSWD